MFDSEKLKLFFQNDPIFDFPQSEAWAVTAQEVITGPRRFDYDHALINFTDLAIRNSMDMMREGLLTRGRIISPRQVILFFLNAKHSREANRHKADNFVDMIGYIQCYQLIDLTMKELGVKQGIEWFNTASFRDLSGLFEELMNAKV